VSNTIASVLLYDSAGKVIWKDTTPVTTGTSKVYTMDAASTLQWRFQINFTSAGAGTVYLTQAIVTTLNANVKLVSDYGFVFGFFLLLVIGIVFAWKVNEWRSG
jgi:hypothetical protein